MALSDHQQNSILLGVRSGLSHSEIARDIGVHRATVGRFVKRMENPLKGTTKRGRAEQSVSFRLGGGELDALDRLVSGGVARNRSDAFRKVVRLLTGYFDPEPDAQASLEGVFSELSAIGRNLNQATREFHKSKLDRGLAEISPAHLSEIRAVQAKLKDVEAALSSVLERRDLKTKALIAQVMGA